MKHVVSYSELSTYRQCPLKHQWAYVERWRKPVSPDGALAKGSLWHLVLEKHYEILKGHKRDSDESIRRSLIEAETAVQLFLFDKSGNQSDVQALITWMYAGYVETHRADEEWDIIGIERPFQVPLLDHEGNESNYDLKGKIDLVAKDRNTGHLWIWDHKSGANLPSDMDLDLDDQFGLYSWALKQEGSPVLGAIHNAARTTRNMADFPDYAGKAAPQTLSQRYSRTYLNRTDTELASVALDAWAVASNAYPAPGTELPLYSAPDPRQCSWKCDFKEVHLTVRKGRDSLETMENFGFNQDFTRH